MHPNYILVYRVGADTVEVVNVLHTRLVERQPPNAIGATQLER